MGGLALALVLASALLHAAWNLACRGGRVDLGRYGWAALAGGVLLTPFLVAYPARVAAVPPAVWGLIVVTGAWQAAYYAALAAVYRDGQFSVSYPLARALPLVLVTAWTVASAVTTRTPIGAFALVVIGCLLLPLRSLRGGVDGGLTAAGLGWTALAGLCTAGYSLVDDRCVRALMTAPGGGFADVLVFSALEAWSTAVILIISGLCAPGGAARLATAWSDRRGAAALGAGITVSYLLVLLAMPLAPHVGWTMAFRQASIPLGAGAAMLLFGERATPPKLVGLALIVIGLAWAGASPA